MNAPINAVVVGVGPHGYEAALQYAVAESRRTQRPLHVVHVADIPADDRWYLRDDRYLGVYGTLLEEATSTLDQALARARELAGDDVPVSSDLIDSGSVAAHLLRSAENASLLVLQHRALSRVKRILTGSVVQGVASRAQVPVVSVPEGWVPSEEPKGFVTAAVQDPVEAPALLRAAFEKARARGAELVVLHAWWLGSGFDVVAVDSDLRAELGARSREEIAPVLAPLEAAYPDVDARIRIEHAPPVEAVLDAAEASDLLVLGRRHHFLPLGSHLGPVARAALDHATCPVLITPELQVATEKSTGRVEVIGTNLAPAG